MKKFTLKLNACNYLWVLMLGTLFIFPGQACAASASRSLFSRAITSARNHPVLTTVGTLCAGYALYKWLMKKKPFGGGRGVFSAHEDPRHAKRREDALQKESTEPVTQFSKARAQTIEEVTKILPEIVGVIGGYEELKLHNVFRSMFYDDDCKGIRFTVELSDGRLVLCPWLSDKIYIINCMTGKREMTLFDHVVSGHSSIEVITLLPDGRLASGSRDGTIRVWNTSTGVCECLLHGHRRSIWKLDALQNGCLVSVSEDNTLRVWNIDKEICESELQWHQGSIHLAAPLQDGRFAIGTDDGVISIVDSVMGHCDQVFRPQVAMVGAERIEVLPNDRIAFVGAFDAIHIQIMNMKTGACERTLTSMSEVMSLAILSQGKLASGAKNGEIRIWDIHSGHCDRILKTNKDEIVALLGLGDGRLISGSSKGEIRIWDLMSDESEGVPGGGFYKSPKFLLLKDGSFAAWTTSGHFSIWR